MQQPQEVIVAKLLPTIRARLAKELLRSYKMKQVDVAKSMGITQAAVSHYNTQSRGVDQDMLRRFPEIKGFVDALADRIARAIVVGGNAPSALFAVCERIEGGMEPSLVIGTPVGFVQAAESKELLRTLPVPSISTEGTRGGSPVAVAAMNEIITVWMHESGP